LLLKKPTKTKKREYFASPFTVAATVGSVLFFLYLFFPKEPLMELLSTPRKSEPLARDYLSTLLQVDPGNQSLRILLARQEIAAGNVAKGVELLRPLLDADTPAPHWEALFATYDATFKEAFSLPVKDPKRAATLARVRTLLDRMTEGPWGKGELERLARDAMSIGNQGAAIKFFDRLTLIDPDPKVAANAAAVALSLGEYRRSAELYFLAQARETGLDARRKWFLAAIKSLQAGNLLDEAIAAAEKHVSGLEDDRETLLFLARLALSAQKGVRAETYLKRLLRFDG
jgi:tetratricopeptide (TPR) repeat protein